MGPNLICISHVYKMAAGHVKNNVFRKLMLHKISSTHGASVESQLQNATSLKQKWSCRHTMLQCIRCMRKQLHGQTECAKGQVRLPYSTRAPHTMKARKATRRPCQRSASYEGLRAYDAVFFLQKRTSQVPGAMQVRATRLQHGSATQKGARPQLPVKKGDKWRGSLSTACVPCRSTLVLALALGATGCLCRLCLVCAYDAPVAVTAAVSAINCTAVIAEPVFLVSALAIPPPPADAAHEGMHGIPMQRLAAVVLTGHDLQRRRHGRSAIP